ncbi:hypothetical protein ABID56_000612 [Alkalibacillus flavidus]|uniref:Sporulation lipoprotein YhcN/YlaJ (Spore_YhcN_YlaJ) n=1 Tax=Alkalibacillus flavidus TaxID=546021 RepID=A0ABV2KSH3_9BACI
MFKSVWIIMITVVMLTGCTFVNPDRESSLTNSQESTRMQQDKKLTDEEKIRLNMYENPYEYFKEKEIEKTLDNSDGRPYVSKEVSERIETERQLYYQLMHLDEVDQAGINIQDDHIYISIDLPSRTTEEDAIQRVKEIVHKVTERTDVTVYVNREFHNRIEDRKK